jgi:hypothetical protein
MKRFLPSHLQRARLSAWATLLTRVLAAAGLALSALLAGASQNGLLSLGFLTGASLVSIAVARAHRRVRQARTALRFHRVVGTALSALGAGGWHLRHDVRWPEGPGEGHLAMTPGGDLAFAIKDCAPAISDFDLSQTQDFATALGQTGRPYIPICVAAASGVQSLSDRGVLCCTPDRLAAELLEAEAGFAASLSDEATHHELLYSSAAVGD